MKEFMLFGLKVVLGIDNEIVCQVVFHGMEEKRRERRGREICFYKRERKIPSHSLGHNTLIGICEPKELFWHIALDTIGRMKYTFFDKPVHRR
jgi:hypothetical protein